MSSLRRSWVMLVVSLLLIAVGVGWLLSAYVASSPEPFTPAGNRASALASESARESASASATPSETASSSASSSPVEYATPTGLRIPALDVNTKIVSVGLDENDNIEIPKDIRIVGWYDLGVPPGAPQGSAVLVAHRDGVKQGRGVFYSIGNLKPGNKIVVTRSDGTHVDYTVASRELVEKDGFLTAAPELFAIDGPPRLTLISCGGVYDKSRGGYQANVIVTAVPS